MKSSGRSAFTLIELSIVLVIIGLIVGGVLVGRNLIAAAGLRATLAQIERYSTAANTFRSKYGQLPGDLNSGAAAQLGFANRSGIIGRGDGNGVIEGPQGVGGEIYGGETGLFWVDLSQANMIDGSFTSATMNTAPSITNAQLAQYVPPAKLGDGMYVYMWSGGYKGLFYYATVGTVPTLGDNHNYLGLSRLMEQPPAYAGETISDTGLRVSQAYYLDQKMDDGQPQSGRVIAIYPGLSYLNCWAAGGNLDPVAGQGMTGARQITDFGPTTAATPVSNNTCYDNNNTAGQPQRYSMSRNNGNNPNCALSFRMQ